MANEALDQVEKALNTTIIPLLVESVGHNLRAWTIPKKGDVWV